VNNPNPRGALAARMVPFAALKARVCRYPVGVHVIGRALTVPSAVAQFESNTNVLSIPAGGRNRDGKACGARSSYFLTFVNDSRRVDLITNGCEVVSNGVRSSRPTPGWLNELQGYTPIPIVGTWRPVSIAGYHGPLASPPLSKAPLLRFDNQGELTGNDGCDDFSGSYQLGIQGEFRLKKRTSSSVGCIPNTPGPPTAAVAVEVLHGRLTFFDRNGRVLAHYERATVARPTGRQR